MTEMPFGRRDFLRGAGVAMALPILEASTQTQDHLRHTRGKPVKRFVCLSNNYGVYQKAFFPSVAEQGQVYAMPETLVSLEKHRKDITIFQNLDHGFTGGHAGVPVLLSGVRPILAHNFEEGNISVDQKLAEHFGSATRFPSMTLGCRERNLLSFTRTGVQVPSISMQQAYRNMFIDEGTASKATKKERMTRRNSILDIVLEQANGMRAKLGTRDRTKLEEYFDSVRTLEKKIQQKEPWVDRPKPIAPIEEPNPGTGTEEQLRAMIEIIALALQTDSTRAITCVSGFVNGDFGLNGGYHGFSHHGEREELVSALKKIEGFQISMMSYLMDLLKNEDDLLNGGSLLDHTAILFGCGMATGTHSTKNLPLILGGGGFNHGEHRVYPDVDTQRVPAANLLLSILQSCGVEIDQFGTSSATLTGLEWS